MKHRADAMHRGTFTDRLRRTLLVALAMSSLGTAAAQERVDGGPLGPLELYRPKGEIRSVALFLADEDDLAAAKMIRRLGELNTLVVGIDPGDWLATLEPGGNDCADLSGMLETLARDIESDVGMEGYIAPMIVGRGTGATLGYAALLQGTTDAFKGAVSLGFCPDIATPVPLCAGTALVGRPRTRGAGTRLEPAAQVPAPWSVLHGTADGSCRRADVPAFVSSIGGATLVPVPGATGAYDADGTLMALFEDAYLALAGSDAAMNEVPGSLPAELADLPLVEVVERGATPAASVADTFAVMYSGDGGWADLDAGVARRLAAAGVPVVGVSSLKYFWNERTPDVMAKDFTRISARYAKAWNRSRVALVGYSLGANVVPFIVTHLGVPERDTLALLALLSPERLAKFQFHLSDWLGSSNQGEPIAPELAKLDAVPLVCAYGKDEADKSLCTTAVVPADEVIAFDGGHHLNDDYAGIAALLLDALAKGAPTPTPTPTSTPAPKPLTAPAPTEGSASTKG